MNKSENSIVVAMNINVNYILTCLFLLIGIIGILGNILVIISVCVDSRLKRSLTNRLIVHVACCDLVILLFNIPDLIQFVSSINGNWILSELSCKLIRSILVLAQYLSVLTMCAVTIERFIGIVYPLRSKFLREKKHVHRITLFVWIFSLICASPNLKYLRVASPVPLRRSCLLQYSPKDPFENLRGYIIHKSIESTIFYFIPLLLQLYCYTRIALQLSRVDDSLKISFQTNKKQNIQRTQDEMDDEDYYIYTDENIESKASVTDTFLNSSSDRGTGSSISYPKLVSVCNNSPIINSKSRVTYDALKARRGVIKMLAVVVLIYFVSFSPQVLVFILFDTNLIKPVPLFIQTPYFIAFTMLLVTISSASNPIVYAIFCHKFRQTFAKIIRTLFFCGTSKFYCHTNQTTTSIQQMPTKPYNFTGKIINHGNKQINDKKVSIQLNDSNYQRK